jgi:hypothetical protein
MDGTRHSPDSAAQPALECDALKGGWFATLLVDSWLEDDAHETPVHFAADVLGLDFELARRMTIALTGTPTSGVVVKAAAARREGFTVPATVDRAV